MKPRRTSSKPSGKQHTVLHSIAFTVEALTILQASFVTLDVMFSVNANSSNPQLPFALDTFMRVRQKIADMLLAPGVAISFDSNEVVILRVSLQIYGIELTCTNTASDRVYRLKLCEQILCLLPLDVPPIND
ncbi:MAG TPA: hypothetical protein VL485_32115 [Ktedonobacteraceae bacterium]|nr:hypothetical protein [Ktedonobacteraceae bacterium]